ncbi:RimK/LysX family protein [Maricurvus nonylphenolicus]|uniref:ATP-dependent zinc protease family protein n=1 Tax=Maricurvus nonylphenolicus TaxID=1008307 RepID=UPI0036F2FDFB
MARVSISVTAVVGLVGICLGGLISYYQMTSQKPDYYTVGETAAISVPEVGLTYLSRIDTGARVTSLHALNVEVEGVISDAGVEDESEAVDKKAYIGRTVRFVTLNENNQQANHTAEIIDVSRIRNAQGVEERYVIELDLEWQGLNKRVAVNLRDRSAMTYKLLIGRNWLAGDLLVDVAQSEGVIQ